MLDELLSVKLPLELQLPDRLDPVAFELLSSEWGEFQINLANLRATLVRTKRDLAHSVNLIDQKEAFISILNERIANLDSENNELLLELKIARLNSEKLQHRINELVTHVEQRDYQIAKLSNSRAIKIANLFNRLKRKILVTTQ